MESERRKVYVEVNVTHDYGVTQKSAGVHYYKANSERNKPISDWEEWQANTLGAAILLPENLIKQGSLFCQGNISVVFHFRRRSTETNELRLIQNIPSRQRIQSFKMTL